MTREQLRVLCELMMVSDPWLLSSDDQAIFEEMLNEEARKQGFTDWLDAYHSAQARGGNCRSRERERDL
jgi:hypothetical protein